jgi:hypothetical protein
VVNDVFQNDDPSGIPNQIFHRGQRRAMHGGEGATVHVISGERFEGGCATDIDGNIGEIGKQRSDIRDPLFLKQD